MKRLLKSIFVLGASQVATTLVAIVRNKLLAILLGPTGVGLLAQLQSFQNMATSAVPMGMQTGALKYFAEFRASGDRRLPIYIRTASRVFLFTALFTTVLCLVFIKPIGAWALGSGKLYLFLIPPLLGVPFVVQSQVWSAYLQAGLEMKTYGKAMVMSSAIGLFIVVPLVLVWRQWGASVHLLFAAVLMYVVIRFQVSRRIEPQMQSDLKAARFSSEALWQLVRFGVASLPLFAIGTFAPFIIRRQIIADLGLYYNGVYQALFAIAGMYLTIPINALNTYAIVRISQLSDKSDINAEVNNNVRVALLINTALMLVVMLNRGFLVRALFSSEFSGAVSLFPWQMMGDFFKFLTFAVAPPIVTLERFRARAIMCLFQWGGYFVVFYAVPARLRLQGAVWGEMTSWFLAFMMAFLYLRWLNGYRFTRQIWGAIAASFTAVAMVAFLPYHSVTWRLVAWGVSLLWAVTACSGSERVKLFGLVREMASRGNPKPGGETEENACVGPEQPK